MAPTVTMLAVMKARLTGATKGHALLKKKADALTMRFRYVHLGPEVMRVAWPAYYGNGAWARSIKTRLERRGVFRAPCVLLSDDDDMLLICSALHA